MTRPSKLWKIHPSDPALSRKLSSSLGIRPHTGQVLVNRGITDVDEARAFLWPELSNLVDPFRLQDVEPAVERIKEALRLREKILIYGDYDVDGVTATALLMRFLGELHADVDFYIPDRLNEGYGMHPDSMQSFKEQGVKLIISVDNGITAFEEARVAKELEIDVIITDHHEPGDSLPDALAVINPKRADATYPFRSLAGVGVAFKLIWAVAQSLSSGPRVSPEMRTFLKDALGLVALGTVADVVPLQAENRLFVHYGLKAITSSQNPGMRALLAVCNLIGRRPMAHDLAFKIGPRVNAAGRLGDSQTGVHLLTAPSYAEALELARGLERENRKRQNIEKAILQDALGELDGRENDLDSVIVLARDGWHVGVLGIVASRLAERFHRPAVLISLGEDRCKGSARSVPEFHIQQAFARCEKLLDSYGGHAQAAGLVIQQERVNQFREEISAYARDAFPDGHPVPSLDIDLEADLSDLDVGLASEFGLLKPFGSGNREPLFTSRNLTVTGRPKRIGRDRRHVSFFVRDTTGTRRAVAFGMGELAEPLEKARVDLAYAARLNSWRGREEVELYVKDVKIH